MSFDPSTAVSFGDCDDCTTCEQVFTFKIAFARTETEGPGDNQDFSNMASYINGLSMSAIPANSKTAYLFALPSDTTPASSSNGPLPPDEFCSFIASDFIGDSFAAAQRIEISSSAPFDYMLVANKQTISESGIYAVCTGSATLVGSQYIVDIAAYSPAAYDSVNGNYAETWFAVVGSANDQFDMPDVPMSPDPVTFGNALMAFTAGAGGAEDGSLPIAGFITGYSTGTCSGADPEEP